MEEWIRWIATIFLGIIIYEVRQLRRDVAGLIPYTECNRRMDAQAKKIDEIDKKVDENCEAIAAIKECHNHLNPERKLNI